jgi:hypothetical protein
MRKLALLSIALMLSAVYPAVGKDRLETTVDLQRHCQADKSSEAFRSCLAFVRQAVFQLDYVGESLGRSRFCAPEGHDFRRYAEIFHQWAAEHPKHRQDPAVLGVLRSLAQAFPCNGAAGQRALND